MAQNAEMVLEDLVFETLENRRIAKLCKTKTLFTKLDKPGMLYTINRIFCPEMATHLRSKYGEGVKILNETVEGVTHA